MEQRNRQICYYCTLTRKLDIMSLDIIPMWKKGKMAKKIAIKNEK